MDNQVNRSRRVWFRNWDVILAQEPIPPQEQERYRHWIIRYLKFCKDSHTVVCQESAHTFENQPDFVGVPEASDCQKALAWFFQRAQEQIAIPARDDSPPTTFSGDVPPPAKADLGNSEWERRLIECIRRRHLLWRTEQTYREWAGRFAQFLGTQPVESAGGDDIRRFLTHLATRERIAGATQKQALNALVFLLREVHQKELGDFSDYTRARRWTRIPDVLTRDECLRLFDQLTGTTRLMAELMYGSGLRLLELLRLRVKDEGTKGHVSTFNNSISSQLAALIVLSCATRAAKRFSPILTAA